MRNAYLYFSILLGLAIFLVVVFVAVYFCERLKPLWRRRSHSKPAAREDFYCVKSSLKQINENFCVAQILFTNRKDCTLTTHGEIRRQSSESSDTQFP
jgi:hypothetical protein